MFMTLALKFLSRYWIHILVATVITGLVARWYWMESTIENLNGEITTLNQIIDAKDLQLAECGLKVDETNALVEKYYQESVKLKEQLEKVNAEKERIKRQTEIRVQQILNGGRKIQSCQEAIDYLIETPFKEGTDE